MKSFRLLGVLLLVGTAALAAPSRDAALRTYVAPLWKAYTVEHVAGIAGKKQWVRIKFEHNARDVHLRIAGNEGSMSAPGTAMVAGPCDTEAKAKAAPWRVRQRKTLILHAAWKDGRWRPGRVEWKDAPK